MSSTPHKVPRLNYRPDVDGLRAVAVLLVIAAHLRTRVSGGYIGVDIFFVISGYLISAHILTEMGQNRFSIVSFYERRVRRIFPALIVVLLATSALAWHFLFPSELRDFAVSMLAAMFSYSNMLFWHQAGYFDAPSLLKPLLHTWSLAVEEQFYLIFPVLLYLIRRFLPTRLPAAIWTITIGTFALSVFLLPHAPTAVFFFAPLRAWELLIGTILSQHYLPVIERPVSRNLASALGVGLIAVPALLYSDATPFPGLTALPACLGAALIIAAGEVGPSLVGRFLSLRPIVFVGLISYSLYLWHWPILVFQNLGNLLIAAPREARNTKLLIFAASLIMGTLSWALVETPFRKGRFRPGRHRMFLINGLATAAVAGLAGTMLLTGGFPSRFSPESLRVVGYLGMKMGADYRGGSCFLEPDQKIADFNQAACLRSVAGSKNYLLIGDSHAANLWPGLAAVFPDRQISMATVANCKPFRLPPGQTTPLCGQMADLVRRYLEQHQVDVLLISGRWIPSDREKIKEVVDLARSHGTRVVLFGPQDEYLQPLPRLLALGLHKAGTGLARGSEDLRQVDVDRHLAQVARDNWKIEYVSYFEDMCGNGCPQYAAPGVPLYFDEQHFTPQGSIAFARVLRDKNQIP